MTGLHDLGYFLRARLLGAMTRKPLSARNLTLRLVPAHIPDHATRSRRKVECIALPSRCASWMQGL
ncbi:MAG: hypothetical protein AAFX96_06390, partial [Pseudomonadota bacterium]